MAQLPELTSEKQLKDLRPATFSDEELRAANVVDPAADSARQEANLVELRKEIAGAKDPAIRKILQGEYNRMTSGTADASSGLMDFKVYGGNAEAKAPEVQGPLMDFKVFGKAQATPAPAATPEEVAAGPNAAFGSTSGGAATGRQPERLRPVAPGREEQTVGPSEKRLGLVAGGAGSGALAGTTFLGPGPGTLLGTFLGAVGGSLAAEIPDPTLHPAAEAVQTGVVNTLFQGAGEGAVVGLRRMLGNPSANGAHLLSIMESRGLVPPAGTVLEGSLAKNMQAIGSSDAFLGQRVQQAVKDAGNVVTDDLRNFVSGYQRFYGGAKQGFKLWDEGAKLSLGEQADIVALDRGVVDKLRAAQRTWESVGAAVDFPLKTMLDDLAAAEARHGGSKFTAFRASLEQAEAVRQLLHQQANALAGTARTETGQAVGKDVAQAFRKAAYKVGADMEYAINLAVQDGRIPAATRAVLNESKEMWKQWRVGEAIENEIGDALKKSGRTGGPITSEEVYGALARIEAEGARLNKPILTSAETARMESIGKALQAVETSQHSTQFTMAVRAGQLFSLSGGAGTMMGAVPFAVIPSALGFIVRNPETAALLIRGLRLPAGSAAGVRAANQLHATLQKEGYLAPVERMPQSADQSGSGQP